MRLGAVGTFVWDTIRHPSAPAPVEQWGGMVYSLAALSAAAPEGWVVAPIAKVGADLAADAARFVARLPRLDPARPLRAVPEPNNRVELVYHDDARRHERLTGGVPPWEWRELEPLLRGVDALYLNFLSGHELGLGAAREIRRAFAGPIYADLHSLFLGPPGDGPRDPRPLERWEEWLACFDFVQLNEDELALLADGRFVSAPERLMECGPRAIFVTLGAAGALVAARGEGAVRVPHPAPRGGDPTGCGDVWGATAFCAILAGATPREAAERAHRAAAAKLGEPRTERLAAALAALR